MACVFCGTEGVTREHVIPGWIDSLLEPGVRTLEQARYGSGAFDGARPAQQIDFVVRQVCAGCNGGWMSRLEIETQPHLAPLMQTGWYDPLTPRECRQLATWSVKTALMFDLTQHRPSVPDVMRHAFFEGERPLNRSTVWLARCADIAPAVTAITVDLKLKNVDDPSVSLVEGFFLPLKLGFAVLLTAIHDADIRCHLDPDDAPLVAQIWPDEGRLVRPPVFRLADGPGFEEFADGFWRRLTLTHA